MANALALAMSPYLLQHKDNPVDWRTWGPDALAEARARDRPILLSVGYAACHWCHVMAHESFEKAAIAAQMNRDFVNVKVDREERPDVDSIYQQALALLGEQGGWPLTMFLTPEGEPFWGGTYFPPEPRYGRPSLPQILERVAQLWDHERDKLMGNRDALKDALDRLAVPASGEGAATPLAIDAAERLAGAFDTANGGIGGTPKFPQAPLLRLVWEAGQRGDDPMLKSRVVHALRRICQGGIYDHLGGGFARYSVDAHWLVPHFEKMLYDNGQLLTLLAEAYAETKEPLFKARAAETIDWLKREMLLVHGLASAIDADSEGEEGRFYVWDLGEIEDVLGRDEARAFAAAYGVTAEGNFEGHSILHRLHAEGLPAPDEERRLLPMRQTLFERRTGRVHPMRDDKVLADWNGLTIQGLAQAAERMNEPTWLHLAVDVFERVLAGLGRDDGLIHGRRDDRTLDLAFLDDYAQMILAAIALFERTGEGRYLDQAETWAARAHQDFGRDDGGYRLWRRGDDVLIDGGGAHDGPTPSPQGSLMLGLGKLALLTGKEAYTERAEALWRSLAGEVARQPVAFAGVLRAGMFLDDPLEVTLIGDQQELKQALVDTPSPERTVRLVGGDTALPEGHPAATMRLSTSGPAAFVCRNRSCLPPIQDARALALAIRGGPAA